MTARAPRLHGHAAVPAVLAGRPFTVLDISVSGSLGLIFTELRVGSQHPFRLGNEGDALDLTARVVRVTESDEKERWQIAVRFGERTRRHQIGAMLARLLRGDH
jgi:hypothetical protein